MMLGKSRTQVICAGKLQTRCVFSWMGGIGALHGMSDLVGEGILVIQRQLCL